MLSERRRADDIIMFPTFRFPKERSNTMQPSRSDQALLKGQEPESADVREYCLRRFIRRLNPSFSKVSSIGVRYSRRESECREFAFISFVLSISFRSLCILSATPPSHDTQNCFGHHLLKMRYKKLLQIVQPSVSSVLSVFSVVVFYNI
jgi:hypothetical protein